MKENRVYQLPLSMQKFREIMRPDPRCQVCLSDTEDETTGQRDRLIQCSLCLSTIHQQHYGSELVNYSPQKWHCQRCRFLLANSTSDDTPSHNVNCEYCPLRSGIMKQVEYEKRKFWVHPECVIWDYPIRTFSSLSFESIRKTPRQQQPADKFWYREFSNRTCQVCDSPVGEFVKCRYFKCDTHYHVTCARKVGVVRQLEKMRIHQTTNYVPIYCTEHLELRVRDFKIKTQQERNKEKSAHFQSLMKFYQVQLERLIQARTLEEALPSTFNIEFVHEEKQRSVSSQKSSIMIAGEDQVIEINHFDKDLCDYLQKELEGCLIEDAGLKVRAVIPLDKYNDMGQSANQQPGPMEEEMVIHEEARPVQQQQPADGIAQHLQQSAAPAMVIEVPEAVPQHLPEQIQVEPLVENQQAPASGALQQPSPAEMQIEPIPSQEHTPQWQPHPEVTQQPAEQLVELPAQQPGQETAEAVPVPTTP